MRLRDLDTTLQILPNADKLRRPWYEVFPVGTWVEYSARAVELGSPIHDIWLAFIARITNKTYANSDDQIRISDSYKYHPHVMASWFINPDCLKSKYFNDRLMDWYKPGFMAYVDLRAAKIVKDEELIALTLLANLK